MSKLRLPEFREELLLDDDGGFCFIRPDNEFPFYCSIEHEDDIIYGYISMSAYYDGRIVATDDFPVKRKRDGTYNTVRVKSAYKKAVKQLRSRYKDWVKNTIYKGE